MTLTLPRPSDAPRGLRRSRACFAALTACLLACGGDPSVPTTTVGKSILSPAVEVITLENPGGGFTPAPPAGSKCLVGGRSFTVTLATGGVAYSKCIGDGVVPYMPMTGSRTLTASELKDLKTELEKLTVVKAADACITDVPMLSVTVKTLAASQVYVDDGFSCHIKDKPFLSRGTIGQVMNKLDGLTP